jgi:hypothetical protein
MARQVTLDRAMALFVEDLEIRKVAPATLKAYRSERTRGERRRVR